MNFIKELFKGKVVLMGFLHLLVSFTSIVVVTGAVGFNLPLAFLFAGVGTLVFHAITKNKIPVTLGVSGVYVGSIISISSKYGSAFAHGGIIMAGLVYIAFALIMFRWQKEVLNLFPKWLLATVVLLIGLSLLPIGVSLIQTSMTVGVSALVATALVDLLGGKRLSMFAMPIGVLVGTAVAFAMTGIPAFPTMIGMEYVAPMFNLESILTIGLLAIPVLFEMMGDTENIGDVIGKDVFKEVGLGRISLGNGLASILGGLGGSNAYTTYSENTAFVMQSRFYNPKAQIWTGMFLILLAFLTPVSALISMIPIEAFGGVATYLFAMITINAIKQITQTTDLDSQPQTFSIMTLMVAVSVLTFTLGGVAISSVAVATVVGVVLNVLFNKEKRA